MISNSYECRTQRTSTESRYTRACTLRTTTTHHNPTTAQVLRTTWVFDWRGHRHDHLTTELRGVLLNGGGAREKSRESVQSSKRHMHSSPSERPISAPIDAPETRRASKVTRGRAPMPTLLGVAPAAPIVRGRPQEDGATAEGDVDDAWDALTPPPAPSQHPPPSCVRPRLDHASHPSPALAAPMPDPLPKHTLDAISIAQSSRPGTSTGC